MTLIRPAVRRHFRRAMAWMFGPRILAVVRLDLRSGPVYGYLPRCR